MAALSREVLSFPALRKVWIESLIVPVSSRVRQVVTQNRHSLNLKVFDVKLFTT